MLDATLTREYASSLYRPISADDLASCTELQQKIQTLTDGEYTNAKAEVDKLRQELGQEPVPSLQTLIEEKSAQCVSISLRC
jgi:hypothetical protein